MELTADLAHAPRHELDGLSKRKNEQTMQYVIQAHLRGGEIRQHGSGRRHSATSPPFSTASAAPADAGQPTVFPAGAEHGAAPRVQTMGHVHDTEQARRNDSRAGSRLAGESRRWQSGAPKGKWKPGVEVPVSAAIYAQKLEPLPCGRECQEHRVFSLPAQGAGVWVLNG